MADCSCKGDGPGIAVGQNLHTDAKSARGLAKNGNFVWIPSEEVDIVFDPLEGKSLVTKTDIQRLATSKGFRSCETEYYRLLVLRLLKICLRDY